MNVRRCGDDEIDGTAARFAAASDQGCCKPSPFARDGRIDRKRIEGCLDDPEPLLFHNEALVRDGKIIGPVTSGAYGHHLGGAVGMAYVPCKGQNDAEILGSAYEIEVAGVRHAAVASLVPMHDPKSERVRA